MFEDASGLADRYDRIQYIVRLMRTLSWRRGVGHKQLAEVWGCAEATVRDYAACASHQIRSEVQDPEEVGRAACVALEKILIEALRDDDRRNAIKAAEVWAVISGARAAERHHVSIGNEPSPTEAARLVRERFGGHAMKDDDETGDTESPGDGELPSGTSGT